MENSAIHSEAPADIQVDKLLGEIAELKQGLGDQKIIISHYKIKSQKLTELARAKKGILDQIKTEKTRIEDEHYENKDYEDAQNESITLKEKLGEKINQLKVVYRNKYKSPQMMSEDKVIKGEQMNLLLEFEPVIRLNGKKLK